MSIGETTWLLLNIVEEEYQVVEEESLY